MDGDREFYLLLFFFVGFDFGFSSGRVRELEELGVRILSFGLGVDFVLVGSGLRLGCKSTMKGSPSA